MTQVVALFGIFHPFYATGSTASTALGDLPPYQLVWIALFTRSSLCTWVRDVRMDWGLANSISKFVFERHMFNRVWVYYGASRPTLDLTFVSDAHLHCSGGCGRHLPPLWLDADADSAVHVSALPLYLQSFMMVLELFRRTFWSFFRLENEHLRNIEGFRRVDFIPLHYDHGVGEPPEEEKTHLEPLAGRVFTLEILLLVWWWSRKVPSRSWSRIDHPAHWDRWRSIEMHHHHRIFPIRFQLGQRSMTEKAENALRNGGSQTSSEKAQNGNTQGGNTPGMLMPGFMMYPMPMMGNHGSMVRKPMGMSMNAMGMPMGMNAMGPMGPMGTSVPMGMQIPMNMNMNMMSMGSMGIPFNPMGTVPPQANGKATTKDAPYGTATAATGSGFVSIARKPDEPEVSRTLQQLMNDLARKKEKMLERNRDSARESRRKQVYVETMEDGIKRLQLDRDCDVSMVAHRAIAEEQSVDDSK